MVTRGMWAESLLKYMALPVTQRNLVTLVAWQAAEGSPDNPRQAKWNPLNTTQTMTGATDFNSVHVKNYLNETQGLDATAKTFQTKDCGYELILRRLHKSARSRRTLKAVEKSRWGTGGLAKSIVDDVKRSYSAYANKAIGQ